jgi:flagella basal body P-ring formation protein FlgA
MIKIVLLVAYAVAMQAAVPGPAKESEITLLVESDRITAGDLAKVLPAWAEIDPSTEVAHAPLPGINRRLSLPDLMHWAKRFGVAVEAEELPDSLLISRHMSRLSEEQAAEHLRAGIARLYEINPDRVRITLHHFRESLVPLAPLEFDLGGPASVFNRPASISLRWRDAGARTGTVPLQATVQVSASHAVARQVLAAQSELHEEDFDFRNGPLPGPPDKFALSRNDVVDKQLKYPLQPGDVLQTWMLAKQETIRRGDLIQLQLRAGSILLQIPGRAEQNGSVGDRITCRNLDSGRRVTATVLEPKLAEVLYQP